MVLDFVLCFDFVLFYDLLCVKCLVDFLFHSILGMKGNCTDFNL